MYTHHSSSKHVRTHMNYISNVYHHRTGDMSMFPQGGNGAGNFGFATHIWHTLNLILIKAKRLIPSGMYNVRM